MIDGKVYVYNKHMKLLAIFDGHSSGMSEDGMKSLMVNPRVRTTSNGESTFSFQMLVNSEKWIAIRDPENIYMVNGRYYTALNAGSYQYGGNDGVRTVNVMLVETWYLLDAKFVQAYNCGLYTYAKAKFKNYTTDGAVFTLSKAGASNPSDSISTENAWEQVKLWTPKNEKGSDLTYGILKSDNYKPTEWENAPSGVFMSAINISGNSGTVTIKARATTRKQQTYEYKKNKSYSIDVKPLPSKLIQVYVNSTVTETTTSGSSTETVYTTSNKKAEHTYNASTGTFTLSYSAKSNETINAVIAEYDYYNLGDIKSGATCTFAYGAEVVDNHTFVILPKANTKYKLVIDGVTYNDNEVKDARGVIMPRGSGGYAMWAALKNSGWKLGICDVIATDFDPNIDYGVFNIESDQKSVLYIVQYIQELYGGILDWDSKNKIVNYRGENSTDYQAYDDGFNRYKGYQFREGKNMKDQPKVVYDNDLITKAYLKGYGGLNVKKVNNGKMYVEDYSYTDITYEGYLEQPLIYDTRDEGGQRQLLYWGQKEIAKKCRPRKTISIEATDIRTVEGHEHEVFDINEIVRVYYHDEQDNTETYEDKRIILWEYNVFAMWDCTVELGDKTQNLSEIFKLIYNTAIENSPQPNATGKLPSSEFTYSTTNQDLNDYLNQTIENNYSSIANLITESTAGYATAELFAEYQKTTDRLISETYAGLMVYADEKTSAVQLIVEGKYTELNQKLTAEYGELNGKIVNIETETKAGFAAQQDINSATTAQFSSLTKRIINAEGDIEAAIESVAGVYTYVDASIAAIDIVAEINGARSWITIDTSNGISLGSSSAADIKISIPTGRIEMQALNSIIMKSNVFFTDSVDFSQATVRGLEATWG